jgi:predicted O-methyltransferase YrrM
MAHDAQAARSSFAARSAAIETIWRPEIARLRIPSIGPSEAGLLASLVAASDAHTIVELGTAIGYSSAYLATAAGPTGRVTAVELNPERAALARELWARAGLTDRITLREGDALSIVREVGTAVDFVFVDILWEIGTRERGQQLARDVTAALRPGGVLIADNCGQTAQAAAGLMEEINAGPYRTTSLLPVGDGMFVAVKA